MYVESLNGHDTILLPENKVAEAVTDQLQKDKWVTVEKENENVVMTKADLPKEDAPKVEAKEEEDDKDLKELDDWKKTLNGGKKAETKSPTKEEFNKKLEGAKSITATEKSKGG